MAELTPFSKRSWPRYSGLAQAAKAATDKVSWASPTSPTLDARPCSSMHDEADETESRCTEVAGEIDGKKTAILEKARETKAEATEMMKTYLGEDADALDGFEFLTMAEAGEVGHWSVLRKLNERARRRPTCSTWSTGRCRSRSATSRPCSTARSSSPPRKTPTSPPEAGR